ncbi:hypothetical protein [Ammoniphilus sp. 3BR4]|uniref:hypothetical protein n=1 Tax=Ammoniphilus sp. 3BR4 TaxID=3158265 RepID=UPI0034655385
MSNIGWEILFFIFGLVTLCLSGFFLRLHYKDFRQEQDKIKWLTESFPMKAPLMVSSLGIFFTGLIAVLVFGLDLTRMLIRFLFS